MMYPDFSSNASVVAEGRVFVDDANSFEYRTSRNFIYDRFTLSMRSASLHLSSSPIHVALKMNSELVSGSASIQSLSNINLLGESSTTVVRKT